MRNDYVQNDHFVRFTKIRKINDCIVKKHNYQLIKFRDERGYKNDIYGFHYKFTKIPVKRRLTNLF